MRSKFDVIITGAGCGGCLLAKKLAEAGFRVALLEIKSLRNIGHPWEVSVEKSVYARIGLKIPPRDTWVQSVDFTRYYAINMKNYVEIKSGEDDTFAIEHKFLNKWLLSKAQNAGAGVFFEHDADLLLMDRNNKIFGVGGNRKSFTGKMKFQFQSDIIVDASGVHSKLRNQVPDKWGIKKSIRKQDYAFAWQALYEVTNANLHELEKIMNIRPGMTYTRLGKYHAYEVINLRRNNTVSLIFGSSASESPQTARELCARFIKTNPYFSKKIIEGGQIIPTRRALDTMVADNFLCVGDTACQVIPTMGSGVASSMYAANIAALSIIRAFNNDNFGREELWSYNYKYLTKRGAVLASYDIIRRFLQVLSFDEIEKIFKAGLLRNENFVNTYSTNKINYDIQKIFEDFKKIFLNIKLLPLGIRFLGALHDSTIVLNTYKKYPQFYNEAEFKMWQEQVNNIFSGYRTFPSNQKDVYMFNGSG